VISADDIEPSGVPHDTAHLRIGTPEQQVAIEALGTHLTAKRLDATEYERRVQSCELARTRAELLRIFDDLPAPRPLLPPVAAPATASSDDDDIPPVAVVGCLTVGLGVPVAVVLGFVYGAWWVLAVPVAVTVTMICIEHLRSAPRKHASDTSPH
jgi:hypothetical protein